MAGLVSDLGEVDWDTSVRHCLGQLEPLVLDMIVVGDVLEPVDVGRKLDACLIEDRYSLPPQPAEEHPELEDYVLARSRPWLVGLTSLGADIVASHQHDRVSDARHLLVDLLNEGQARDRLLVHDARVESPPTKQRLEPGTLVTVVAVHNEDIPSARARRLLGYCGIKRRSQLVTEGRVLPSDDDRPSPVNVDHLARGEPVLATGGWRRYVSERVQQRSAGNVDETRFWERQRQRAKDGYRAGILAEREAADMKTEAEAQLLALTPPDPDEYLAAGDVLSELHEIWPGMTRVERRDAIRASLQAVGVDMETGTIRAIAPREDFAPFLNAIAASKNGAVSVCNWRPRAGSRLPNAYAWLELAS